MADREESNSIARFLTNSAEVQPTMLVKFFCPRKGAEAHSDLRES